MLQMKVTLNKNISKNDSFIVNNTMIYKHMRLYLTLYCYNLNIGTYYVRFGTSTIFKASSISQINTVSCFDENFSLIHWPQDFKSLFIVFLFEGFKKLL